MKKHVLALAVLAALSSGAVRAEIAIGDTDGSPATATDHGDGIAIGSGATTGADSMGGLSKVAIGSRAMVGDTATAGVAIGQDASASGDYSISIGGQSRATEANSTAVGAYSEAIGANSTAIGFYSQAAGANSAAIGNYSVADEDNTVSVGSAGNERRITNVADGVNGTDAVNVQQLNNALAGVQAGTVDQVARDMATAAQGTADQAVTDAATAQASADAAQGTADQALTTAKLTEIKTNRLSSQVFFLTETALSAEAQAESAIKQNAVQDQRIDAHEARLDNHEERISALEGMQDDLAGVDRRIDAVDRKASRGIASLAAMQAVHPSAPGKTAVGAGVGHYGGETALAVTVAHAVTPEPGEQFAPIISLGVGLAGSGGSPVVRAGAAWEF